MKSVRLAIEHTPETVHPMHAFVCESPAVEREVLLFEAFERETVVVVPPTEFRADTTMRLTVVGHGDDLQGLVEALPDELDVDVLEVGSYDRALGPGLTDRQREAVTAAQAVGYYEIPREATSRPSPRNWTAPSPPRRRSSVAPNRDWWPTRWTRSGESERYLCLTGRLMSNQ